MANVDLSNWDKLSKWTQHYYHRSIRSKITNNNDGTFTCLVDFSMWESAEGTGASKAAAKAAAAEAAWNKIENGDFVGDNYDIEVYNDFTGEDVPLAEY